ncbi:hypothetical protein FOVSG1_004876 [Fusarium oxysporum f. sp. vasinfectum]
MVSQLSYHHGPFVDVRRATLASNSRFSRIRWRRLRQKFSRHQLQTPVPINTSTTTVDSSDTNLEYGIPAAASSDLSHPLVEWGHQATPWLYRLLSKLNTQSAPPNNGYYKTYGNTSHRVSSKKVEKSGHKGKSTVKDARNSGSGGGGKGGKGKGGNNSQPPPDGYRFPPLGDTRPPKTFGCPFYMTDPLQFHKCSSLRLRRPNDVSQHIMRSHLLRRIKLVRRRDAESTDNAESEERMQEAGTCTNANDIRLYHTTCRIEFCGPNAEENRQNHCDNIVCYKVGIEQTGVLLPSEFRDLIAARDSVTGSVAKWYAMWGVCFPPLVTTRFRTVPASPYVETTVPREQGEYTIRQALRNMLMGDRSLTFDQVVNQIYLGDAQTDIDVQQTVQYQQQERDLKLQQADYDAFYQSASSQQAMDWDWDNPPPDQHGGPH